MALSPSEQAYGNRPPTAPATAKATIHFHSLRTPWRATGPRRSRAATINNPAAMSASDICAACGLPAASRSEKNPFTDGIRPGTKGTTTHQL